MRARARARVIACIHTHMHGQTDESKTSTWRRLHTAVVLYRDLDSTSRQKQSGTPLISSSHTLSSSSFWQQLTVFQLICCHGVSFKISRFPSSSSSVCNLAARIQSCESTLDVRTHGNTKATDDKQLSAVCAPMEQASGHRVLRMHAWDILAPTEVFRLWLRPVGARGSGDEVAVGIEYAHCTVLPDLSRRHQAAQSCPDDAVPGPQPHPAGFCFSSVTLTLMFAQGPSTVLGPTPTPGSCPRRRQQLQQLLTQVESDDQVDPYDGSYACGFCSGSVRGAVALKCSQCSSNPVYTGHKSQAQSLLGSVQRVMGRRWRCGGARAPGLPRQARSLI